MDESAIAPLAHLIGNILHEPRPRARDIALDTLREGGRSQLTWNRLAAASPTAAVDMAQAVRSSQFDQIADFVDRSERGILVTSIHGGDYLLGLLKLTSLLRRQRQILVVRRRSASDVEERVFRQFSCGRHTVAIIRHGEGRTLQLIRALRRGEIVVALCDLPGSYGPTTEVQFLGHTMRLVNGPAELARLGQADIIPVTCSRSVHGAMATCHSPIRNRAVDETCQLLARIAEDHIRQFPRQWQHWFHVPEMLGLPGAPGAD
jgi:lauroyl/myristoyl acyltransferase